MYLMSTASSRNAYRRKEKVMTYVFYFGVFSLQLFFTLNVLSNYITSFNLPLAQIFVAKYALTCVVLLALGFYLLFLLKTEYHYEYEI